MGIELLWNHQDLVVRADKAHLSAPLAAELWDTCHIRLLTRPRSKQHTRSPAPIRRSFNAIRQMIETMTSQLVAQFQIEITHAYSVTGLIAGLSTKLTAHVLCIDLNRLLGEVN